MYIMTKNMGFGGSSGISMDGVSLQHTKSCSDRTRIQEDECHGFRQKIRRHKLGDVLSESQSKRDMNESPSRNGEYLREEVLHLEKLLEIQIKLRHALESCLEYSSSSENYIDTTTLPEPAAELIEDVVELKFEVAQLEKYLSSLYLKAFYLKVPPSFPSAKSCFAECSQPEVSSQQENANVKLRDLMARKISNSINDLKWQCQSSLSKPLASIPKSANEEIDTKAVCASHSLTKLVRNTSGARIADLLSETPNRLSEDMIKCMSAIYCKLSNPPSTQLGVSSRSFSPSSTSQLSPLDHSNQWSPALSFEDEDVKLNNPFNVQGLVESNGPYSSTLVEVPLIYRDAEKLGEVEYLLRDYQSIISQLEEVDPRKLTHGEKIAFWVNIHNSLVMNAFIAFGIPHNNLKRAMYLHKAAYNIGGYSINAETIQSSILRCRMCHHRQWIRKLFPSRSTFKIGDEIQAYAIDKPEPLLYLALATGSYSDPAVHAFTPTGIFHELETAKNDYIRATLGIVKNRKILLPKLVESFCRDSNITHDKMLNTVLQSLPESFSKCVKKCLSSSKSPTTIEWVPHNFSFRYLISIELAKYSNSKNT